jgi:hypothetical protein
MSPTFLHRFFHQLRQELRLLAWPAVAALAILLMRLWYRLPPSKVSHGLGQMQDVLNGPISLLAHALPMLLVIFSMRADGPSNPNTASLTRPIGGGAMTCAKLVAYVLLISVPWLLGDLCVAGFAPHNLIGWGAITVSSLGNTLYLIALTAAVACLARSKRQLAIVVVAFVVAWMGWRYFGGAESAQRWFTRPATAPQQTCAGIVAMVMLILAGLSSWWQTMARRSQRGGMAVLIAGVLLVPAVQMLWRIDWLSHPALVVKDNLALHIGAPDPKHQSLWPRLHVAGLGPDEVALILPAGVIGSKVVTCAPWRSITRALISSAIHCLPSRMRAPNSRRSSSSWIVPGGCDWRCIGW